MKNNELHQKIHDFLEEKQIFDNKIDYILKKDFDNKGIQYVCYISRTEHIGELNSLIFDVNEKVYSFNVADWDFNIDDFIFHDLQNDYEIYEMSADTHFGVWNQIDELRDEIQYDDGLQKYLTYCRQNHIDKNFMKQFYSEIDVMDLYQEKNGNYVIIASCDIGNSSVVLGYNQNSPSPYVTWSATPDRKHGYYTGHYGVSKESAFNDYKKRCKDCLDNYLSKEKDHLEIKDKKSKGAER